MISNPQKWAKSFNLEL